MGFLKLSRNQSHSCCNRRRENSWGLWARSSGTQEAVSLLCLVLVWEKRTWLIALTFIDVIFYFSQKSSRWPRSEAISTGSELPNGCSSLIYFHGHAVMGFWLSIITPCGPCKLLWSGGPLVSRHVPCGSSVLLACLFNACWWTLLPGSVLLFSSQLEVGLSADMWQCRRSKVLVGRSACTAELISKASNIGLSSLCPCLNIEWLVLRGASSTNSALKRSLPREVLVSQQSHVSDSLCHSPFIPRV